MRALSVVVAFCAASTLLAVPAVANVTAPAPPPAADSPLSAETGLNLTVDGRQPGDTAVVTVRSTRNGGATGGTGGQPVANATVALNGTVVARTNESGRAAVTLPHLSAVNVTATTHDPCINVTDSRNGTTVSKLVELNTTTEVSIEGDPVSGGTVTVRATLAGDPFADAFVSRNGQQVARTDANGTVTLTVPYNRSLFVTVYRGDVAGVDRRDLPAEASVSLSGLGVPGTTVTVRATVGGEPLRGATVRVAGRPQARTDASGTATVRVPLSPRLTRGAVTVRRGAVRGATPLGAAWYWRGVVVAATVALAVVHRRYGLDALARDALAEAEDAAAWLHERALDAAYALGDALAATAQAVRDAVADAFAELDRAVAEAPTVADAVEALLAEIEAALAAFRLRFAIVLEDRADGEGADEGGAGDGSDDGGRRPVIDDPGGRRVVDAWERLARETPGVTVGHTPADVAATARERFPADPVDRITAAFRELRYGHRSLPSERVDRTEAAAEGLAEGSGGEADEDAEGDGGGDT